MGKPVADLSLKDLHDAAKPVEEGGKGVLALQKAMEMFKERRNIGIGVQLGTTALVIAGLGFATLFDPLTAVLAGGAAFFYNEVHKMVEAAANITFNIEDRKTITKEIRRIADQVGLGGRVSSTRVLGVFVEADAQLQQEIIERYGDDYENLTIAQKRRAVKEYDESLGIYRLTQDINSGCVNPTELGFLAYGQTSGVPRCDKEQEMFDGLPKERPAVNGARLVPSYGGNAQSTAGIADRLDLEEEPENRAQDRWRAALFKRRGSAGAIEGGMDLFS
jgi:hypothetical protein